MMMKKRFLCFALACMMLLALTACGGKPAEGSQSAPVSDEPSDASSGTDSGSGETLKVGCVVKFQHEFYTALMDGAKDAAAELNLEIEAQAPSSPGDVMGQVQLVEDLVTKGVDILLLAPNQPSTLTNILDQATGNGTTLVAVDTNLPDYDKKTAFVGTGNKEALYTAATEMAKLLPQGANVIILRGPLGDANHELRAAGATEGLEAAGCNVLEVFDAQSTSEKAAAATEDFLLKYQAEGIDGILCCDDDMAVGAATAVEQAEKLDTVKVSGYDGNAAAVEMVGSGRLAFTMAQAPYQMGYQAVMLGYKAHMGEPVDEVVDTGVQIINADNYQDFL